MAFNKYSNTQPESDPNRPFSSQLGSPSFRRLLGLDKPTPMASNTPPSYTPVGGVGTQSNGYTFQGGTNWSQGGSTNSSTQPKTGGNLGAPKTSGTGLLGGSQNMQQPGTNFSTSANAQRVLDASQPSALGQGAANASAMYGMLGNERQLAPFAGGITGGTNGHGQDLLQSYANLTRPQSTGNLQGEMGLFDVQRGILQGAANTSAAQALQQQQLQQHGAESVLGAGLPQAYSYNSNVMSPLTGQQYGAGGMGQGKTPFDGGLASGQFDLGKQSAQYQATLGKVSPMVDNLTNLIKEENINPTDLTAGNMLINWAKGNLSSSSIPKFQGQLNDIVSSLSTVLGVPSTATSDFRTQFAGAIVNGLQNGQSITDAVNYAVQQAQQASAGYASGAQGANSTGIPNTNSGGGGFGWDALNY